MGEPAKFEVDENEAAQPPVEEKEVDSIPLISDPQPFLACQEGEVVPEFEKKALKVPNECLFELAF